MGTVRKQNFEPPRSKPIKGVDLEGIAPDFTGTFHIMAQKTSSEFVVEAGLPNPADAVDAEERGSIFLEGRWRRD